MAVKKNSGIKRREVRKWKRYLKDGTWKEEKQGDKKSGRKMLLLLLLWWPLVAEVFFLSLRHLLANSVNLVEKDLRMTYSLTHLQTISVTSPKPRRVVQFKGDSRCIGKTAIFHRQREDPLSELHSVNHAGMAIGQFNQIGWWIWVPSVLNSETDEGRT